MSKPNYGLLTNNFSLQYLICFTDNDKQGALKQLKLFTEMVI